MKAVAQVSFSGVNAESKDGDKTLSNVVSEIESLDLGEEFDIFVTSACLEPDDDDGVATATIEYSFEVDDEEDEEGRDEDEDKEANAATELLAEALDNAAVDGGFLYDIEDVTVN